jgi:tripartite-type tricarboxylate transporter receptor subunit TctC
MAVWEDSMKLPHRRKILHLGLVAALSFLPHIARAQGYPSRPITIIVPFVAGGPSDWLGRLVAERLRVSFSQPVIIENVAGANGSIGVGRVARAAPDGYTLLIGLWNTHVANGAIYALPYDVQTDFEPVGLLSNSASLVVARKSLPADDLKGLVEWLKANPGKATEGHVGIGSVGHLSGLLLQNLTGTRFQQVPYRGSAPVMQDLVAGQIDFGIEAATTSLPQFRAGNIKAFAVARQSRLTSAMEIPTVDEAGLPGLYVGAWFALYAPKGTPNDMFLNSMPRFAVCWTIPRPGHGSPNWDMKFQRQASRLLRHWPHFKGLTLRSGGRSSKLPTLKQSRVPRARGG